MQLPTTTLLVLTGVTTLSLGVASFRASGRLRNGVTIPSDNTGDVAYDRTAQRVAPSAASRRMRYDVTPASSGTEDVDNDSDTDDSSTETSPSDSGSRVGSVCTGSQCHDVNDRMGCNGTDCYQGRQCNPCNRANPGNFGVNGWGVLGLDGWGWLDGGFGFGAGAGAGLYLPPPPPPPVEDVPDYHDQGGSDARFDGDFSAGGHEYQSKGLSSRKRERVEKKRLKKIEKYRWRMRKFELSHHGDLSDMWGRPSGANRSQVA